MTKKPRKQLKKKRETTNIAKKYTEQEVRDIITKFVQTDVDPRDIFKDLGENILPYLFSDDKKESKKANERFKGKADKALMSLGVETDYALIRTIGKKYQPLILQFNRQLVREYDCQSSSEKALVHIIVNAYVKVIDSSERFSKCLEAGEYLSDERTKYLAMLSKQLDRANRQFITALTTLKQLKAPSLEINVKAKTAFIAQNQQLNVNPKDKDENITPK